MGIDHRDFREWESFAKSLAARYATPGIELVDLEQEALLTLLEELPKYAPELGVTLRVFLGRGIRNRLASLYRKTLNLVQVEQFLMVVHKSGDKEMNVRVASWEQGEAVIRSNPGEYTAVKHVKVTAPIGPSLDAEADDLQAEGGGTLHEAIGVQAEQEWIPSIHERVSALRASSSSREGAIELDAILQMKREGYTLDEIGARLGKKKAAICMAISRAQKRLSRKRAA